MLPFAPLLAIVLPIVGGAMILAFRKHLKPYSGWVACVASLASVVMIISMAGEVVQQRRILDTYIWIRSPTFHIALGFMVDGVSYFIGLTIAIVGALSCIYSLRYMEQKKNQPSYYANLLFFVSGMIGVVFSENFIQFYMFWELILIPSYFLISHWGVSKKRSTIAFKYFIFTHIGTLFMLVGILSIYTFTGTFDFIELRSAIELALNTAVMSSSDMLTIFALLLIGFSVKMAIFPVHTWLPDAHTEAPSPISALLSGVMLKCGAYAFARVFLSAFGTTLASTSDILAIVGLVTMVYGGLMALAQDDIKRLLAYSSVSQMGYIFLGLSVYSTLGATGALFHIVNHAICKSLLFLSAGAILRQTGTRSIARLGGLAGKMPLLCATSLIGALSLIGIPPLSGFWSEWMIFSGGIASGKILITTIAVVSTAITAGYYLWFLWRVFFGPARKHLEKARAPSWTLRIPILTLAVMVVVIGIYPDTVLKLLSVTLT